MFCRSLEWGTSARAQVQICPLFRISETDGRIALKFHVLLENRLARRFQRSRVGTAARAHPFSYLENGWTDCAEIWYAVRDPLDELFAESPIS